MADVTCPYCGQTQHESARCNACGGFFEPLSRDATQLAMGPWFIRDEAKPFMPGFSAEVLRHQAMSGRIKADTILRGPTTNQFWLPAAKVPGVSRLLGHCHACAASVAPHAKQCPKCAADLTLPEEVDKLGLKFTTDQARAQAQRDAAAQREQAPPKPAAPRAAPPSPASMPSPTPPNPQATNQPLPPREIVRDTPANPSGTAYEDTDFTDSEGQAIEELWDAAPTRRPRRSRRGGADPLVIGLIAVTVLAVIVAGYFAMSAASKQHDKQIADQTPTPDRAAPAPQQTQDTPTRQVRERTAAEVDTLLAQVLPVLDRLNQSGLPAHLNEAYDTLADNVEQAQAMRSAGDLNGAYLILADADRAAAALDLELAEHAANMDDRAAATDMQAAAYRAREQALADDAEQWAPPDWALAEESLARGEAALAIGDAEGLYLAYEEFRGAVSDFEYARSQASLGFLAVQAGEKLDRLLADSFSGPEFAEFGGEAYPQMQALRARAQQHLEVYEYYEALDAFETAQLRLTQAERGVKRAYGVKYYAFAAGYAATDALIAIAAGDGLSNEKRGLVREAFGDLSLTNDPVDAVPAGPTPDYAASAQALVTQARQAIADELGPEAQLSYSIGFQFRIVQQTLDNPRLNAAQSRRIERAIRTIQSQANEAGYSGQFQNLVDTFRQVLHAADEGERLERARAEWRDLLILLRTYDQAMPIVNPGAGDLPPDPELFPGSGD